MSKTCIKCGYVRQATDTKPDYECPKCGVIYAKAEAAFAALDKVKIVSTSKNRFGEPIKETPKLFTIFSTPDFTLTQQVMGTPRTAGLSIDEPRKKICLVTFQGATTDRRVYPYSDIVSVELLIDNDTVSTTITDSRAQAGGALIGGLVFGTVGAIVGSRSGPSVGKTTTLKTVKRIALRVVVHDPKAPLHEVVFMDINHPSGKTNEDQATSLARYWHGILEGAIANSGALPSASTASALTANSSLSIADEIQKLASLHSSGILDANEFQKLKLKLLGA